MRRQAFTFIDLFAGIGGFRLGLEKLGGECVFSCEWDKYSRQTYEAWYGEAPFGDIRSVDADQVPDHDILAGGFPCQPFSLAGVSKKNSLGRLHGFLCDTQGTLFFEVAKIIGAKRPAVVFLENVKNLRSHDGGKTWKVIHATLEELGYWVFFRVIDAAGWVPQHRERVYIVCFDKAKYPRVPNFHFPPGDGSTTTFGEILEPAPDEKYTLSEKLWLYLQNYAAKHKAAGHGFGFGIADMQGVARTLSARYYKDGSEILVSRGEGERPRRLTPRECARLMGFEPWCEDKIVVSDTQAYRQFGNAVVPKVIEAVGRQILQVL